MEGAESGKVIDKFKIYTTMKSNLRQVVGLAFILSECAEDTAVF